MSFARSVRVGAGGRPPPRPVFPKVIRPGLDRVRRVLALLGHPQESFAAVLVGGTNGKGSVSAMIESGLRAAGVRTGLYTSPHLVNVRERTRIGGSVVGPSVWARATVRVADVVQKHRLSLTEFEAQTVAAFLVFQGAAVELAVLEVGLGGRLDAVNTIAAPELSVITSIGLDHTAWLGPTLRHIYFEKRGIARAGTVLLQDLPLSLHAEARRFAAEVGVPTWTLGDEIRFNSVVKRKGTHFDQRVRVRVPGGIYAGVRVPFWGAHQARNGALAVAALHVLRGRGWPIRPSAIENGVAQSRWPGRFDVVQRTPPVVLDGAHNPAAARALAEAWKVAPWGRQRAALIFSCLKDKDIQGIAAALSPVVHRVIVTALVADRARPVEELAAAWRGRLPTESAANFRDAWKRVMNKKTPVLVAGSLYLVGEAMTFFRRRG